MEFKVTLNDLGWSAQWESYLGNSLGDSLRSEHLVRIIVKHRNLMKAISAQGVQINCYLSGKMQFLAEASAELPSVGDWCVIAPPFVDETNSPAAIIQEVLPRYSKISRMGAGLGYEQVLAANVDYAFIVTSANRDFNVRRLQRYVLLARNGETTPVIVLSKADLTENVDSFVEQVQSVLDGVDVVCTSCVNGDGLSSLLTYLLPGKTGVFIGSSGVGKSTLVNVLLGQEVQKTQEIREDDSRGKHTTSFGGLFFLKEGGMVIDTAGLREVSVLGEDENLEETFPRITQLAGQCKFRDCSHASEPSCAIKRALSDGELATSEWENYLKLQREMAFARRKIDRAAASAEKQKWKRIAKDLRRKNKERG